MDKPKILIVDDEPINIMIVAESLQDRYVMIVATNGEMALNLLKNQLPDLILLDINMPKMNGFEVLEQIHRNEILAQIPVIFLTGESSETTVVKAFNAGAVDYIIKPFHIKELNVRVDNHIRSHTLHKNLQKSLEKNRHLLSVIDSYVPFVRVDVFGIIQEISTNFCKFLGCSPTNMIGENINVLRSGYTPVEQYRDLWKTISLGKVFTHEIEDRNFSGSTNWYRVTISPEYDDQNNLEGYIAFYENIDEKIRYKKHSETDALTLLPNRFMIDETLVKEERRANRFKKSFSIILIDIDHFKEVNDKYGHQVGDQVLQEFSTVFSNNIRTTDFLGRWGGEEFLVICPETNTKGAFTLADNLRMAVEEHVFSDIGHKTASFGVAEHQLSDTLEVLFGNVDKALYRAKENGRNQVISFSY